MLSTDAEDRRPLGIRIYPELDIGSRPVGGGSGGRSTDDIVTGDFRAKIGPEFGNFSGGIGT